MLVPVNLATLTDLKLLCLVNTDNKLFIERHQLQLVPGEFVGSLLNIGVGFLTAFK